MATPTPSWNTVRVFGTWRNLDGTLKDGTFKVTIPARVTSSTDDDIVPAGTFLQGTLQTSNTSNPSLDIVVPATDDPDIQTTGWNVQIVVTFTDGSATENYAIDVPYANRPLADGGNDLGVDLRDIALATSLPQSNPLYKVGVAGGLAQLDANGDVIDADGNPVTGAVDSVNGQTGVVVLAASDVSAVPTTRTVAGHALSGDVTLVKGDVGLGNVDNTSDVNKPVSTAQQTALDAKADLVGGVIPTAQIPAIALGTSVPVADQAAMLALTAAEVQPGDVAVRADGAGTFMLMDPDPSLLANWTLLNAPTDVVTSVAGQTGTVVLAKADVGLDQVDNTADLDKPISDATQTALDAKLDVGGAITIAQLPAGSIESVTYDGSSWPARPTARTDIPVFYFALTAADPAPGDFITGTDYLFRPTA